MALVFASRAAVALWYSQGMKATIELDEALARRALAVAQRRGLTLEQLAEEALRHEVKADSDIPFVTAGEGGLAPGVDLENREQLAELIGPP